MNNEEPSFEDNCDDPELPQWRIHDYDFAGYDPVTGHALIVPAALMI